MAKEKIFKPEDFKKEPTEKGSTEKRPSYKKWLGFTALLVLLVVCLIVFKPFSNSGSNATLTTQTSNAGSETDSIKPSDSIPSSEPSISEASSSLSTEDVNSNRTQSIEKPIQVHSVKSDTDSGDETQAEAMKVIRGDYGNGQTRKDLLGARYHGIQNRVNELKRLGVF